MTDNILHWISWDITALSSAFIDDATSSSSHLCNSNVYLRLFSLQTDGRNNQMEHLHSSIEKDISLIMMVRKHIKHKGELPAKMIVQLYLEQSWGIKVI